MEAEIEDDVRVRLGIMILRSKIKIQINIEDRHLDQKLGSKKEGSILDPDQYP
jgi:hypothetical protein